MMNEILPQVLAELNLKPGECQRVQVNGYHLEIRRPNEEPSDFAEMVMLEPWVVFPASDQAVMVPVRYEPHPLPVPPEIPDEEEIAG